MWQLTVSVDDDGGGDRRVVWADMFCAYVSDRDVNRKLEIQFLVLKPKTGSISSATGFQIDFFIFVNEIT